MYKFINIHQRTKTNKSQVIDRYKYKFINIHQRTKTIMVTVRAVTCISLSISIRELKHSYASATANLEDGEGVHIITKRGIDHTALIQDTTENGVIQEICNEIREIDIKAEGSISPLTANVYPFLSTLSTEEDAGMSDMVKVNYTCNTAIGVSIFDNAQNEVACISPDDFFGFDGSDFIYYSYADQPGITDATIYMPNSGYKIVFSYGDTAGVPVDFDAEVSSLNYDGWKDASVTYSVGQTLSGGIISSIDGTINSIDNANISNIIAGTFESHFTDWELPDIIKLNNGNLQTVNIIGSDSAQVSPLLNWSSADESVVTVSSNGVVEAVSYGKATISATDGNKVSSCEIVVMQNATSVNFPNVDMLVGEKTVITPNFAPVTATETAMTYTYDKGSVINIDDYGVIHALSAGTVTVTGTTDYGISSTFVVTVTDPDFITRGDINGDGDIGVLDLIALKNHLLKKELLIYVAILAADINEDSNVDILDLLTLKDNIMAGQ